MLIFLSVAHCHPLSSLLLSCCGRFDLSKDSWFGEIVMALFSNDNLLTIASWRHKKGNSTIHPVEKKSLNDNYHTERDREEEGERAHGEKYMRQNVYSRNRKSHFQFDVTSKSDLSNHRAPFSKWLAKCDVHKLTLQINMEKKKEKERQRKGRTSLRIE